MGPRGAWWVWSVGRCAGVSDAVVFDLLCSFQVSLGTPVSCNVKRAQVTWRRRRRHRSREHINSNNPTNERPDGPTWQRNGVPGYCPW